ncbi:uncharacterized protein LOC120704825 [Panicum virgatum]|uniref:Uncharacterized protein n=1 Tax=Panicum virgatum TaxID=38727 RepID=A0A8T0TK20_PANVG|nr:uncharacterized protein LOC120704825 [Panicum virgatum]KAG2612252.1 hypothetical protein PVAP13_4KG266505 [Panicum virgatum]
MAVEPNMARRLWHVVRAVLYMLRKGVSKRKLAMDLHLLLQRGKIAGKALGNLMTAHGHHHHHDKAAAEAAVPPPPPQFSCRALDPALAVYDPRGGREVEFSCSNTPSYPSLHLIPTGKRRSRGNSRRSTHRGANGAEPGWYNYDAADIARVFEILNNNEQLLGGGGGDASPGAEQPSPLALIATPSPALWASFGRTPAHVRQLRITDSPFPLRDDAAGDGGQVDREAEEFIKKFYDQLRTQQSLATTTATPDYSYGGYPARPVSGIA